MVTYPVINHGTYSYKVVPIHIDIRYVMYVFMYSIHIYIYMYTYMYIVYMVYCLYTWTCICILQLYVYTCRCKSICFAVLNIHKFIVLNSWLINWTGVKPSVHDLVWWIILSFAHWVQSNPMNIGNPLCTMIPNQYNPYYPNIGTVG